MPQCIQTDSFDIDLISVEITWDEGDHRYIYSDKSMSGLIQKVIDLKPQQSIVIISVGKPNELLKVASGLGYSYNIEYQKEYRISIFNSSPEIKVTSWKTHRDTFEILDVRELTENPFDAILDKAKTIGKGEGFILIQTFEPTPMINMLLEKGFEHLSEQVSAEEFRIYFYRSPTKSL